MTTKICGVDNIYTNLGSDTIISASMGKLLLLYGSIKMTKLFTKDVTFLFLFFLFSITHRQSPFNVTLLLSLKVDSLLI